MSMLIVVGVVLVIKPGGWSLEIRIGAIVVGIGVLILVIFA